MDDIYAVCLSVSQSVDGPRASAFLNCRTGDRSSSLHIEWDKMPKLNPGGDPGAWLYAVLGRLVEDFDDHVVTEAKVDGTQGMEEDANG